MSRRKDELEKALKEEKARTVEAEARCKEAEAKATKLQEQLNDANAAIVKKMQDFMNNFVPESKDDARQTSTKPEATATESASQSALNVADPSAKAEPEPIATEKSAKRKTSKV